VCASSCTGESHDAVVYSSAMSPLLVRDLKVVKNSFVRSSSLTILFLTDCDESVKVFLACSISVCKRFILAVRMGEGRSLLRASCVMRMVFYKFFIGESLILNLLVSYGR
jgi:hypothetical protein